MVSLANNSPDKHSSDKIPFPVCIPLPDIALPFGFRSSIFRQAHLPLKKMNGLPINAA